MVPKKNPESHFEWQPDCPGLALPGTGDSDPCAATAALCGTGAPGPFSIRTAGAGRGLTLVSTASCNGNPEQCSVSGARMFRAGPAVFWQRLLLQTRVAAVLLNDGPV